MSGVAVASAVLIALSICRSTSVAKSRSPLATSAPMCARLRAQDPGADVDGLLGREQQPRAVDRHQAARP